MDEQAILTMACAVAVGSVLGFERMMRGQRTGIPAHIVPALLGALGVIHQPAFVALGWFIPIRILLWLACAVCVMLWCEERMQYAADNNRTSELAVSLTTACALGIACAFGAFALVGLSVAAIFATIIRSRVAAPANQCAPSAASSAGVA